VAFSYSWESAIELLKAYGRNMPVDKISSQICDFVSSEMWSEYPWKDTCQTLAPTLLETDVQDMSVPPNIFKLVSGQIVRLTPQFEVYEPLGVAENLSIGWPTHPQFIRQFSIERGEGLMRLGDVPSFAINESFELRGTYQLQHRRVTDLTQDTWFKDQLWQVAAEGLLYWGYKLGDSPRRAELQYRVFKSKLGEAWRQEDAGSSDNTSPSEGSIGAPYTGW
jgi:hypothetical protein